MLIAQQRLARPKSARSHASNALLLRPAWAGTVGGHLTEQDRGVIFAGQNPDDVRARWLGLPETVMFDDRAIDVNPAGFDDEKQQHPARSRDGLNRQP
jgi:hypothetical protein